MTDKKISKAGYNYTAQESMGHRLLFGGLALANVGLTVKFGLSAQAPHFILSVFTLAVFTTAAVQSHMDLKSKNDGVTGSPTKFGRSTEETVAETPKIRGPR